MADLSTAMGMFAGLLAIGIGLIILFFLVIYLYTALVWYTIAKKLKHNHPWVAWIPIANIALVLQLGEFHWAWIFLLLVPVLGWIAIAVLYIIATWRIFEARKFPGWLSLVPILGVIPVVGWVASIAYLIILGFVAWKDN